MQLTPRTLGMALGACLAGGLVLGIAGTLSASIAVASAPTQPASSPSSYSAAVLGDAQSTFTGTSPSATPLQSSAVPPTSTPIPESATKSSADSASPTPSTITTTAPANESPEPARAKRPNARPLAEGTIAVPKPPATTPLQPPKPTSKLEKPEPSSSWSAPNLAVGVINIAPPKLTSGARPSVTVMCSPSAACGAAGNSLTIDPEAQRVTVTWSTPRKGRWAPWVAIRAYSAHAGG